jgi:hypothetical protein
MVEAGIALDALLDDAHEHGVQPRGPQEEVDEPGPGDVDPLDVRRRVGGQVVDDLARQLAGVAAGLLGGGEGDVR